MIFYGSAQSWLQYSKTVLISSMKLLFVFHTAGLIISGGYGIISGGYKRAPTSIETFPTAQLTNCTIPSFHQCNLSSFSFIRCSGLTPMVVNRIPPHTMFLHCFSPPKGEWTTPSPSSTMVGSLWPVEEVFPTPALLASLGAVGKMNGKNMQH